ncbi:hypothetical protein ID866_10661 [Astraeus odoratus]|nr:hypothetical protein ID866_10661 [Astraeus odoratus]
MQWHHLFMEGLVGQQQLLISRLVELSGATGSGVLEDEPEDALENGAGAEDGAETEG